MADLKELAAMTALNNMMQKAYFDICAVDRAAKLMGRRATGEAYDMLHALHCIDFAKIPVELRDALPQLIEDVLGVKPSFQFTNLRPGRVIDVTPAPEQTRNPILRLLGR